MRLRLGRCSYLAKELLGDEVRRARVRLHTLTLLLWQAAEIVDLMLDHGQLRVQDTMSLLGITEPKGSRPTLWDC